MDRQTAIQEIRSRWRELYPQDKKGGIICPLCNSGSGEHGSGITENKHKPGQLKCWACDFTGDALDLIQQERGTDLNGALQIAADMLNISIDPQRSSPAKMPAQKERKQAAQKQPAAAQDLTEYYRQCRERITAPAAVSYLQARGISPATAAAFNIGFDPAADPAQSGHRTARLIIPITAGHYIGRSIDPATPKAFAKLNNKGAESGLFNTAALYDRENTFIVEGVFDALSVAEAGAAAIALNSTSNAEKLLKQLERESTGATLILCLDSDDAGRRAAQTLKEGLQRLDISYLEANIAGRYKDPNEYLTADRAGFIAAVQSAQAQTAARPDNVKDYISRLMTGEIERFREAKDRKTGFPNLDEKANGLFAGLYVIAAISSLGKTSYSLQLADQLAAAGTDVIFFSLEQSRLELVSKSLARITAQNDMQTAVNSLAIRRGYLPEQVLQAADDYTEKIGERLSIVEGNFSCNVSFIGEYARRYIRRTGCKPVIFVDYLQILQGEPDRRQTTKETIDSTVTELKRLSRDLDLTIFVISSVNRANYLQPIDFESLKETGAIEFTADVIWGLQLQCLNDPIFDTKENIKDKRAAVKDAKAADPRKIELVCLKNRYGISSFSCYFDYYPAHDLFIPGECESGHEPYKTQKKAGRKL